MPKGCKYTVFGLTLESELALPELFPSGADTDAVIRIGNVPEHLENPAITTPWLEVKPGAFLLTVDAAGKYYVENGQTIIIEPFDGADEDDLRTFLYDHVLAALLQQRGILALHASAAVLGGQAIVMTGSSPSGKSVLAHTLYTRGQSLLADDLCAVGVENGQAVVYPGIPRLALWKNALKHAGIETDGFRPVRRGLQKYSVPVRDRFAQAPVALSRVFHLHGHNQAESSIEPIQGGGNKIEKLMQQQLMIETAPDRAKHFALCARVGAVPTQTIAFHLLPENAGNAADIIQKEMGI